MNVFIHAALLFLALIISCNNTNFFPDPTQTGSVDIRVWITDYKKSTTRKTDITSVTWEKLIIQVSANDMDTLRDTFELDTNLSFLSAVLEDIPVGSDREFIAWTIDKSNDILHTSECVSISVEPGQVVPLALECEPITGSIYIQLTQIPASVDSVSFTFASDPMVRRIKVKKTKKMNLCLDKIPFETVGMISIIGYNSSGDTVASWFKENFKFTNNISTLDISFVNRGKIEIQVSIKNSGITIIRGIMSATESLGDEKGGLIITEIMYAANDSEYIEIYNPQNDTFSDTIIIQKDFGSYRFFDVTIPPKGFYTIGRQALPWGNTSHPVKSALDLSSTTGNWLVVRSVLDSNIYDIVSFQAGTNKQEWPVFSTSLKTSIILDSLCSDPEYNNYGRNWKQAMRFIDTTFTKQLGTPGIF